MDWSALHLPGLLSQMGRSPGEIERRRIEQLFADEIKALGYTF